ncbi:unnamed protein product, partial [Polarella glacialis]
STLRILRGGLKRCPSRESMASSSRAKKRAKLQQTLCELDAMLEKLKEAEAADSAKGAAEASPEPLSKVEPEKLRKSADINVVIGTSELTYPEMVKRIGQMVNEAYYESMK